MSVSKRLRFEIFNRDNNACRYCGGTAPDVKLTIDHVIPVSLGGSDSADNLVAACADCNAGKTSSNPNAPVVDSVKNDAIKWAEAMSTVAEQRRAKRVEKNESESRFLEIWNSWGVTRYNSDETVPFPLPANWQQSLHQFLDAGLDFDDLRELFEVAVAAKSTDVWKYFCGCCWKRVRAATAAASELVRGARPESVEADAETAGSLWEDAAISWTTRYGHSIDECLCVYHGYAEAYCGDPVCADRYGSQMSGKMDAWMDKDEPDRTEMYVEACGIGYAEWSMRAQIVWNAANDQHLKIRGTALARCLCDRWCNDSVCQVSVAERFLGYVDALNENGGI